MKEHERPQWAQNRQKSSLQADLVADHPSYAERVVEDRALGQVAYELEHIGKPLTHALGRLAPQHLRQAHVGVGGKLTVRYLPL